MAGLKSSDDKLQTRIALACDKTISDDAALRALYGQVSKPIRDKAAERAANFFWTLQDARRMMRRVTRCAGVDPRDSHRSPCS